MGEVAALSAAFEAETNKTLATLPSIAACQPSNHDAHLNHHRVAQRITELIAYYSSRLPPNVCVGRVISIGDRLSKQGEYRVALDACYTHVQHMSLHLQQAATQPQQQTSHAPPRADHTRLSYHVQACYGRAVCEAALAFAADPSIKHPATLETLVACLHQLKAALTLVLPVEALYWLTLNGTVHIYSLSMRLLTAGFITHMLPFMLFCVKSVEQHVTFSTAKYLPWRTQLHTALCYAYIDAQAFDEAKQVVKEGLARIDALIKLQKLDPVPAPPENQAAYRTAKAMLCALQLKLEVQSAPSQPPPPSPPPTDKKSGAAAADKKAAAAAAAQAGAAVAALQPLLTEVAINPKFKLTVMLEALQVPGRRVVRHAPVHGLLKDLFDLAYSDASILTSKLSTAISATQQADAPAPPASGDETAVLTVGEEQDSSTVVQTGASTCNPPEAEEFSLLLHRTLLCTAYSFEQATAIKQLLELAQQRLAVGAVGGAEPHQVQVFAAATHLLQAANLLEQSTSHEVLAQVAATLAAECSTAHDAMPDMLTDVSLALHVAAKPLLDGVYGMQDKDAELALNVQRSLYTCWQAVHLDDALLRVAHALRLALLLEERAQQQSDDALLYEARQVLVNTREATTAFRCELAAMARGAPDEGYRWITASRNQPRQALADLVAAMPDTDAELACLHTDVLAALFRVEMAIGVAEQRSQAVSKQTRLTEAVQRREAQSNIFGVRTMKDKRVDDIRIADAAITPSNPPAKERELLLACGKNLYEKALALMQIAPYQCEQHRQVAMLTEAAELLEKVQAKEEVKFAAAQPERSKKTTVPLQPKILQRTPTSITLTNFPFNLKGGKRVSKWAVYAKPYGAGAGLILNKTASEYPGTGVQVPPGTRMTIEGLRSNDTYVFANAAFDENGNLIGELGTSLMEIMAGLPLPIYHCWAHLLQTACRLKLWPLAKRAAGVLFPHFIVTEPDRPLWESNPMNAQELHEAHVAVAARPLLRALVQCIYAFTGSMLTAELDTLTDRTPGSVAHRTTPPLAEVRAPYLDKQVARLKSTRRLIHALEVSVLLGDELLVQEGAVRAYHLLGPLLVVQDKTPMLHSALAALYASLQHVSDLAQNSQVGQELQRHAATRVACGVTHFAIGMASKAGEHNIAAHLAGLQMELLKAYDPRFVVPGRAPTEQLMPDIAAVQDALLSQPAIRQWLAANPGSVLDMRHKDSTDLAAQVLPIIAGPTPMEAWSLYLSKEEAVQDTRWVELVVRMLEACVRCGHTDGVQAVAQQVHWQVKLALVWPRLWFPGPKWRLQEAAAAVTGVVLSPDEEPAKPQLDGMSDADKAAAEAAWAASKETALQQARCRWAAVKLLQRRLPVLLQRKHAIDVCRGKHRQWLPWRSRLAAVVGLLEAAAGRAEAAERAQAAFAEAIAQEAAATTQEGSRPITPASPGKLAPRTGLNSPTKGAGPNKPGTPIKKGKAGALIGIPEPSPTPRTASAGAVTGEGSACLRALQQLARAAQLAARDSAWHELLNASRHTWNVARMLLNTDAGLMQSVPAVVWEQGTMPAPAEAPPSMLQPAGKDAKGGKAAAGSKKEDPKAKGKPSSAKGGKKGAVPETIPEPVWPPIWLATGSTLNAGRVLRASGEALLQLVAALKSGAQLCTGVLPLGAASGPDGGTEPTDGRVAANAHRPATQASATYASSNFSYGSDMQVELWFQTTSLDMDWVNQYMGMLLASLYKMRRWHAVMALGTQWLQLCEGHYNESVLPLLLSAAPQAGQDAAPLQAAMEIVVRDKNAALDALHKVRAMIRDKLGDVTPLNQPISTHIRKKRRAGHNTGGPRGCAAGHSSPTAVGADNASMVSAYTYGTHSSLTKASSSPDFLRLPVEYEKVIEVLKQRGEKGAMILATAELGDVHAHFGNWSGAVTAWSDALDTLMGPYQVVKNWRKVLDPLSGREIIQKYGLHGCLLSGGVLLGKLARYGYWANQGQRLEACRMASVLLRSIFCVDAVHPQRLVGFASYVPQQLWQGVNVFADPYRCNMSDLLSGLETCVSCLLDAGLALEVLPVCALWEHVACKVSRNLAATVLCRIQRVHACVQLGLMRDAAGLLVGLMQGSQLPDPTLDSPMVVKDNDGKPLQMALVPPFNTSAYPGDASNRPVIQLVAEGPFPATLHALYGEWAVARLALARAAFLQALGQVPNLWTATTPAAGTITGASTPSSSNELPAAYEQALLQHACDLMARAQAMARGEAVEPEAGPRPVTPSKGVKPAAGAKKDDKKDVKKDDPKKADVSTSAPGFSGNRAAVDAQRCEVMVRSLLAQSLLECQRWRPQQGLTAALGALQLLGSRGESGSLNAALGDNDDTERFSLGSGLWLEARLQAVVCTMHLRNTPSCHELLAVSLKEAAEASDHRAAAALLHVRANLHQLAGETARALETYHDVVARCQALQLADQRLVKVLYDAAALRDQLGLREDAQKLFLSALTAARAWVSELGLNEAKEHTELVNIYTTGLPTYAQLLSHAAVCAMRQKQLPAAAGLLEEALLVQQHHSRVMAVEVASTALQLGRAIRLAMFLQQPPDQPLPIPTAAPPQPGTTASLAKGAMPEQLQRAQALLSQAFALAAVDGGQQRDLMRAALLELASLHVQGMLPIQAAACLHHAQQVAIKKDTLMISSHTLMPVAVGQMPAWAKEYVTGEDAAFAAAQQEHGAAPSLTSQPMADADLGRLLMCLYTSYIRMLPAIPVTDAARLQPCIIMLHRALKSACPKYSSDACLPDITLPSATPSDAAAQAAVLLPGTVLVQWAVQDGCWQEAASWHSTGSLSGPAVSDGEVMALQPVETFAAMLYVVVTHDGAICMGEQVFRVSAVRAVQQQARVLRHRCESPKSATDIFGMTAPSAEELSSLRKACQHFLGGKRSSDEGGTHLDVASEPEPDVGADAVRTALRSVPQPPAKGKAVKGKEDKDAAAAVIGPPKPAPTDLQFLVKLEALLNVEGGIEIMDAAFAAFLAQVLP